MLFMVDSLFSSALGRSIIVAPFGPGVRCGAVVQIIKYAYVLVNSTAGAAGAMISSQIAVVGESDRIYVWS